MDIRSVTRPPLPSTRAVVAGAHLCDQISTLLLVEPKIARQAFLGEPVEEVMARAEWALKHEGEAGFDSERIPASLGTEERPRILEDRGPPGRGVWVLPRDGMGARSL
jgi:hypothetical protein